jgi:L-lactate dehydrogenase complex protein LldG
MSSPTSAREEILARIRTALPSEATNIAASYAAIPHLYNRAAHLDTHARLELLLDRLLDYDTEILQITAESEIPSAIAQALAHSDESIALIDPAFPADWLPAGPSFVPDHALTIPQLEAIRTVVTTCEVAVASTGTIILVHGPSQGRRAITLLPDHHICLVRRDQIVEVIPEAIRAVNAQSRRPITTISGPSATSDIEMTRIRGVHGPRRLTVILYGEAA